MNKNDFIQTLFQESKKREKEWVLTEKQTEKIKKFYNKEDEDKNLTFIKINSIISVLLIVFGTLMFFSWSRDNMNAFSKIFVILLWLWAFGSTAYLFIKRKDLNMWFVLLWITSIIFWIALIILNQMLDIYLPYYVIFFFRFLCIMPFVLIFKFKYFLIFAILLLNISTFLFVYYFYADYFVLLSLILLIVTGATLLNIKRIYRVFQSEKQYLESKIYYNMIYLFWILEFVFSYLILTQNNVIANILGEIKNISSNGTSYSIFLILSFLPLATLIFTFLAYYFRKKKKFDAWQLIWVKSNTKRNFKAQILDYIKNEKLIFLVNLSIVILVFILLSPVNNFFNQNNLSFLINILFLLINSYFFYEWILLKIEQVTNMSIFVFFVYFIFKYFSLFYDKVNWSLLIIWWWVIFLIIWLLIEKNRQIILKYIGKNIKDWSQIYLE